MEGAADAGGSVGQVGVFPAQAEEFALAEPCAQGEFEQCAQPVPVRGGQECACLLGGEGFAAARAEGAHCGGSGGDGAGYAVAQERAAAVVVGGWLVCCCGVDTARW